MAHSTSGYGFKINDDSGLISWGMTKQDSIALFTQHAEIIAGSVAACEAVHLRGILGEAGFPQNDPTNIDMDASSAIDLAHDPMMVSKTKHIDRRDLFIRELVERKIVKPTYIPTAKNFADALTKTLARGPFMTHRTTMLGS